MSINKFFLIFTVAIIFFSVGFGSAYLVFKINKEKNNSNNTFQAGWEAARNRLIKIGFIQVSNSNIIINSVVGKIESIEKNIIEIKIIPLEPLADPNLDNRKIVINNDTKIVKYIKKDDEIYQKEFDEYIQKTVNNKNYHEWQNKMPSQYELRKTTVSDLIVGAKITVKSSDNLKNQKTINAEQIIIQLQQY